VLGIAVSAADCGYSEDIAVLARQPRALDATRFSGPSQGVIPDGVMTKIGRVIAAELDLVLAKP
jgi:hypothetical protein